MARFSKIAEKFQISLILNTLKLKSAITGTWNSLSSYVSIENNFFEDYHIILLEVAILT